MTISEFTILDPKPSLLSRIIVSAIYTIFIGYAMYLIRGKILTHEVDIVMVVIYMIWLLGVILMMTVGYISRHGIQFSFKELKIRHIYDISLYRYKEKWQELNDLNYLSIYKEDGAYNVIMWYEEHNFLNLFSLKNYNDIVEKACQLSDGLKIELLDATVEDDFNHWVNKEKFKNTGKIEYKD